MKKIITSLICIVLFAGCFNILDPKESFSIIGKWANPTPYLLGQGDNTYDTLHLNSDGTFLWRITTFNGCPYPGDPASTICDGWKSKPVAADSGTYSYENDSLFLSSTRSNNKAFGVITTSSSDEMMLSGSGYNSLLFKKFR